MTQDRPTRFVVAWSFGPSEDAAIPEAVSLTRQRTAGQGGVPWVSDGRNTYRSEIRRVYRDPQRTGKRGRPPLVMTPGLRLTQAVKHKQRAGSAGRSSGGHR